jgi:uncharacterized protein (TIGR02996 family)
MSDGVLQGLIDSVRAAPRDDAPRRVLADYFESSGDSQRAELLRLQLDCAGLDAWDHRAVRNRLQQWALLHENGEAWRAALPEFEGVVWGRFERGFVSGVAFDSVATLVAHAAACSRATPLSKLIFRWPRLEDRVELPVIDGMREVTVVGTLLQPDDMAWLANSPLLSTVRALNLVETQMDEAALRHLLASPHLERLEALRLPVHDFGNAGVELLVQASLPNLVDLDLSVASLDDLGSGGRYRPTMDATGAAALARWPGLSRLRRLDLTGNQLGTDGLTALLSSPGAAGLKTLRLRGVADWDMDGGDGRPDVLTALAATAEGMALDELDISECDLTKASGAALIASPALAELKVLRFNYTNGNPFTQVVQAPLCESLRVLWANDCGGDAMRTVLGRAMPNLHTLSLSSAYGWSQAEDVAEILASAPPQPALLELRLEDTGIGDEGLDLLGQTASFPALLALQVGSPLWEDVEFSEESAERFAASPLGVRLVSLDCGYDALARAPEPRPIRVGEGEYSGALREL